MIDNLSNKLFKILSIIADGEFTISKMLFI